MKVKIIYKGGEQEEIIECNEYFAHSSGGWMFLNGTENIFISSSDIRKLFKLPGD